eukprot:scaffold6987_cov212-Skeletonema_marinoi.AAC.2
MAGGMIEYSEMTTRLQREGIYEENKGGCGFEAFPSVNLTPCANLNVIRMWMGDLLYYHHYYDAPRRLRTAVEVRRHYASAAVPVVVKTSVKFLASLKVDLDVISNVDRRLMHAHHYYETVVVLPITQWFDRVGGMHTERRPLIFASSFLQSSE